MVLIWIAIWNIEKKFHVNIHHQTNSWKVAEKSSFFSQRLNSVLGDSNHFVTEISFQNDDR
jgi:hypothetical protein